jgi:adenine-specific DNA methylase
VFAIQGYCSVCAREKQAYGGRFFMPLTESNAFDTAGQEWSTRKENDLNNYWPKSEIPFGHMTHQRQPLPQHGYLRWADMFNPRQLLVQSQLLKAITKAGNYPWDVREYVLAAFQQFLRNLNMFCFWHKSHDHFAPALSNSNFHPKSGLIEVGPFSRIGYGPWPSVLRNLDGSINWKTSPWELVSNLQVGQQVPMLAKDLSGRSSRAFPDDPILNGTKLDCQSATDLSTIKNETYDLVITDPPFGGLLHYSELSDFFYVWLRLVLKDHYPDIFNAEYTPKTLEAVANKAREPEDADGYYQRLLTAAWSEAHRILKPGGMLAFTFHHSEDAPWVAVLESLFEAGFYLAATYPIRSDEIKGGGEFGSRKIEFDIVHVCRKRREEPKPVSWAKMRREVLRDVRELKDLLEHHKKEGLPDADLQVIKRGKALEYYSRHYGKVLEADEQSMAVKDALLGINLLLDEESGELTEPPPTTASALTSQFLRLFNKTSKIAQDQIQKFLRGTGYAPSDFVKRGWCTLDKKTKTFEMVSPLEIAQTWHGKHRVGLVQDYDQSAFIIGACFENSGINATDTLKNMNFKPHPALGALLEWFANRGASTEIRNAAIRASSILRDWKSKNQKQVQQMSLFFEEETTS